MTTEDYKKVAPTLPKQPGVYRFLDGEGLVIYVGKAKEAKFGTSYNRIQLNDKIATADEVPAFIINARSKVSEAEVPFMTTSIKADKESSVGTITDIRLKLRDVNALKISYSASKGSEN